MLQNLKIVLKPLQTVKRLSILSFELLYKNETATDIFLCVHRDMIAKQMRTIKLLCFNLSR